MKHYWVNGNSHCYPTPGRPTVWLAVHYDG